MSDVCEAKEVVKKLEPKYAFAKIEGGGGNNPTNPSPVRLYMSSTAKQRQ